MAGKNRKQTLLDYASKPSPPSKALVPNLTQKSLSHLQNPFSPLQTTPELPYKSILATFPQTPEKPPSKNVNISIPNSSVQEHRYIAKSSYEEIGLTPYTYVPPLDVQKTYVNKRFSFPESQWETSCFQKNQKFYELVLIATDSVEITHNPDDSGFINYSKCIIKRVLNSTEFGGVKEVKTFPINFPIQHFNFYDYKKAWSRAFLLRPFNHSWFFSFHTNTPKNFPIWFYDWWRQFGSTSHILPPTVKRGLEVFTEKSSIPNFHKVLAFHAEFKVPWILAWDFSFQKIYSDPSPVSLIRRYKIKWWKR